MDSPDTHRLVDNTLYVERHKDGEGKGIIGRCTCGWNTGYRFSSAIATVAFDDHFFEMTGMERRAS